MRMLHLRRKPKPVPEQFGNFRVIHTRHMRYNRTVRHEWLDQNIFETIEEAQDQATKWLWTYNNDRPNMAIGGITPAQKLNMKLKIAA